MAMQRSVKKGVLETLQAAGSVSGNGTVLAIGPGINSHTFNIVPDSATFSAGKVQIEASNDPTNAGTWQAIGAEVTLVTNTQIRVTATGPLAFVRARISTTITGGGTVAVTYEGTW